MDFVNNVLSLEDLPRYEEVKTTPVSKEYKKVIIWNFGITVCILGGIDMAFFFIDDLKEFKWIAVALTGIFLVLNLTFRLKAFERRSWAVRDHDIIHRHGILSAITTVVPFNRIQHVSVKEGIFSRMYGLAALQIFTAGGNEADLKIAGLPKDAAEQVKGIILEKIKD